MIALYASLAWGQETVPEPVPTEPVPTEPVPEELPVAEVVEAPPAEPPAEPAPVEQLPEPEPSASLPAQEAELYEPPVYPRRFGLDIQYGWLNNSDPAYDLFAGYNGMISFGFATQARFARNLALVASWHHVRQGADVYVSSSDTSLDFQQQTTSFRSALFAHEMALGGRVDVPIVDIFFPFLSAQGQLVTDRVRLDDVKDDRDNPTQVQAAGLHTGGLLTGGMEVRVVPESRVQAAFTLEMGYSWLSRATLGDLGEMKPGGFVVRAGAGLRF